MLLHAIADEVRHSKICNFLKDPQVLGTIKDNAAVHNARMSKDFFQNIITLYEHPA